MLPLVFILGISNLSLTKLFKAFSFELHNEESVRESVALIKLLLDSTVSL